MSSMGAPVGRNMCPLPLRQCGSTVPSQSPPRSGLNSSPPLALFLVLSMALLDFCIRAVHIARCMNINAELWHS